jgi:hypothetical protein
MGLWKHKLHDRIEFSYAFDDFGDIEKAGTPQAK